MEQTVHSLRAQLLGLLREMEAVDIDRAMALDAISRDLAHDLIALVGPEEYSRIYREVLCELDQPRIDAVRIAGAAAQAAYERDLEACGPGEPLFDE